MSGWRTARVEDCVEKVKLTGKIQRKDFLAEGKYPIVSQEAEFINGYWNEDSAVFRVKRPVVIFGDHTQVLKLIDFDFVLGADGVKLLIPNANLDPRFFYYAILAAPVRKLGYARHYRLLAKKEITFPLSLDEQKQIVTILDKVFAGIAKATENAERNLAYARELFDGAVDAAVERESTSWTKGNLEHLVGPVATGPFGSLLHKSDYVTGGTPIVNPAHLIGGQIVPDADKTVGPEAAQRLASYSLAQDDIVVGRRGEMGRCAVVSFVESGWLCGTGSFFIRPKRDVAPEFIAHLLRSNVYRRKLLSLSGGATMPNLSNRALGKMQIALPERSKQDEMLSHWGQVRECVDQASAAYERKAALARELKQSLLHRAFTGQLTSADSIAT